MNAQSLPRTTRICDQLDTLDAELQQGTIKPYPASLKKRDLILQGLIALGDDCQATITPEPIGQAAGDTILLKSDTHGLGDAFASFLNAIPVRHGTAPTTGFVQSYNQWAYVEQHDALNMLRAAVASTTQAA